MKAIIYERKKKRGILKFLAEFERGGRENRIAFLMSMRSPILTYGAEIIAIGIVVNKVWYS